MSDQKKLFVWPKQIKGKTLCTNDREFWQIKAKVSWLKQGREMNALCRIKIEGLFGTRLPQRPRIEEGATSFSKNRL